MQYIYIMYNEVQTEWYVTAPVWWNVNPSKPKRCVAARLCCDCLCTENTFVFEQERGKCNTNFHNCMFYRLIKVIRWKINSEVNEQAGCIQQSHNDSKLSKSTVKRFIRVYKCFSSVKEESEWIRVVNSNSCGSVSFLGKQRVMRAELLGRCLFTAIKFIRVWTP